jgi:mannose-6-phosphate isomerase-like protein (cupin superfamily)
MFRRRVEDSPRERRGGQVSFLLLGSGEYGSERLAVTWVEGEPGSQQPLHRHADAEQVYVIVRGRGEMIVGDERKEVGARSMIFTPPGTDHAIRNIGTERMVYVSATSAPFDAARSGRWRGGLGTEPSARSPIRRRR